MPLCLLRCLWHADANRGHCLCLSAAGAVPTQRHGRAEAQRRSAREAWTGDAIQFTTYLPIYLPICLPTYLSSAYLRTSQFEAVAEQKRSADLRARHGQVKRSTGHTHTHTHRQRTTPPTHTHDKNNTPNLQTNTPHKHLNGQVMRISSLPTYFPTCLPPTYLPTSYLPTYLSSAYLRTSQFEAVAEQKRSADLRAGHEQVKRSTGHTHTYTHRQRTTPPTHTHTTRTTPQTSKRTPHANT